MCEELGLGVKHESGWLYYIFPVLSSLKIIMFFFILSLGFFLNGVFESNFSFLFFFSSFPFLLNLLPLRSGSVWTMDLHAYKYQSSLESHSKVPSFAAYSSWFAVDFWLTYLLYPPPRPLLHFLLMPLTLLLLSLFFVHGRWRGGFISFVPCVTTWGGGGGRGGG